LVMKWYGCWVCGGSALVKYYLVVGMTVDGWCEWVGDWVTSDVVVSRVVVGLLVKIMNSSYCFLFRGKIDLRVCLDESNIYIYTHKEKGTVFLNHMLVRPPINLGFMN
jgi:hypothetical protein